MSSMISSFEILQGKILWESRRDAATLGNFFSFLLLPTLCRYAAKVFTIEYSLITLLLSYSLTLSQA